MALSKKGFRVAAASEATEALRLALGDPFDAIVVGHKLRRGSGLDLLVALKDRMPDIPTVFVVPPGGEELALRGLSSGASGFLMKTPGFHQLLAVVVEEQLGMKKAGTRLRDESRMREEAQTRYRELADAATTGVFLIGSDGAFADANDAFLAMAGCSREELIGRTVSAIFPTAHADSQGALMDLLRSKDDSVTDTPMRRPDGREITVEVRSAEASMSDGAKGLVVLVRDVTDRKRAEEATKTLEDRLRTVVEAAPLIHFALDARGIFTFSEGKGLERLGLRPGEVVGRSVFDVYRDTPEILSYVRKALAGVALTAVVEVGGRAFEVHYFPRRDDDGRIDGVAGVAVDVSERRRSEKLRDAAYRIAAAANRDESLDELYRSIHAVVKGLMPAANFYIALHDPEAGVLQFPYFVDEAEPPPGTQPLGRGLTEYVLRTGQPLLATPAIFAELVRSGEVIQVGPPSLDWVGVPLVTKDRTIGVLAVQSYLASVRYTQEDLDVLRFIADQIGLAIARQRTREMLEKTASDLAALRQSLAESEQLFRGLVEQSLVGTYLIKDGRFAYVNPRLADIFGYEPEELLTSRTVLDLVAEEDRPRVAENLRRRVTGEMPTLQYAFHGLRKDGSRIEVEVHGAQTVLGGQPAIIGALLDITERRAQERERLDAERLAAVGEIAGLVARKLLDPLANIQALTSAALRHTRDRQLAAKLEEIEAQCRAATNTVADLSKFTRTRRLRREPTDLRAVLEGAIEQVECQRRDGTAVDRAFSEEPVVAHIDPVQMQQVFADIIRNALDGMTKGTVTVRLTDREAAIEVSVESAGSGTEEEAQALSTGSAMARKQPDTGAGLRLARCREILEAHGGRIDTKRHPGQGSTVSVHLPKAGIPALPPPSSIPDPPVGSSGTATAPQSR